MSAHCFERAIASGVRAAIAVGGAGAIACCGPWSAAAEVKVGSGVGEALRVGAALAVLVSPSGGDDCEQLVSAAAASTAVATMVMVRALMLSPWLCRPRRKRPVDRSGSPRRCRYSGARSCAEGTQHLVPEVPSCFVVLAGSAGSYDVAGSNDGVRDAGAPGVVRGAQMVRAPPCGAVGGQVAADERLGWQYRHLPGEGAVGPSARRDSPPMIGGILRG